MFVNCWGAGKSALFLLPSEQSFAQKLSKAPLIDTARLCWKCFEHVCIYSVFKIIQLPAPLTIKYADQWCQDFLGLVPCQKFLMCHRWLHGTPMNEPIAREASWSDPIPQARVEVRAIAAKQNKVFSIQPQLDLASVMFVSLKTKRCGNIQQHFWLFLSYGMRHLC